MKLAQTPVVVSGSRGLFWVKEGFRLLMRRPLIWTLTMVLYWSLVVLTSMIPALGVVLPALLSPALSFGFIAIARGIDQSQIVGPRMLLSGFRDKRTSIGLLQMGAAYGIGVALVVLASWLVAGDWLGAILNPEGPRPSEEAEIGPPLGLLVAMLAYIPVTMAFWFAPQLLVWGGFSVGKSIFYSFFAVWRNRSAFLRFALAWGVMIVGLSTLLSLVLSGLGGSPNQLLMLALPLSLLLMAIAQGSFYASTVDLFSESVELGDREGEPL